MQNVSPAANSRSPVAGKIRPIVNILPDLLDVAHMRTDPRGSARLRLDVTRGGKVIGMRMGVENPVNRQTSFGNVLQDRIRAGALQSSRTSRHNREPDR
jgi:hypothetical protein